LLTPASPHGNKAVVLSFLDMAGTDTELWLHGRHASLPSCMNLRESDESIARRILGERARREAIGATKNEVSSWSSGERRIVIKRWGKDCGVAAANERAVYQLLSSCSLSPRLLDHGHHYIVLEWLWADPVVDTFTPEEFGQRQDIQRHFINAVAEFHHAIASLTTSAEPSPIPGPICAVHGDLLPHNVLAQNDGRVFLIDFELVGTGPLYLDLVPMLCVLPRNEVMILVGEYHKIRQTVMDADACAAILQQLPALRLARLRGQRSIFRDDEQRFRKMVAWFEYAAEHSKRSLL
jgi:hypothetical protein